MLGSGWSLCRRSPAKREAPRSDWDTGVVSSVGTPMPKSARALALLADLSDRATQPGRLPRAPSG
ncbi:hypothetical protein TIFTF001_001801 [Ficus carica]|uniref:Uncharacterized protein n=1 Tax=Ficus carica TaxID=3494 RepID=A0AA87ZJQ7_FICCA|nr:hypothetical protein TIFTF001_001801 [Ficus carica]